MFDSWLPPAPALARPFQPALVQNVAGNVVDHVLANEFEVVVDGDTAAEVSISGNLTVAGETAEATFSGPVRLTDDSLQATVTGTVLMSDFGVGPINVAGLVKTGDDVELTFELVANRTDPGTPPPSGAVLVVGAPEILGYFGVKIRGGTGCSVVRVIDGDTLEVAGRKVRLFAIDTPEDGQRCRDGAGQAWNCARWACRRNPCLPCLCGTPT